MRFPLAATFSLLVALRSLWSAEPKPVPLMQAVPQAHDQISFERDGAEIARYHYGPDLKRPFIFPLVGPSGRSVTRIGHPRDPQTHSHHNSVWISHQFVGGVNFWEDAGAARIVHIRTLRMDDSNENAFIETENGWLDKAGTKVLTEFRRNRTRPMLDGGWMLEIDMQLEAPGAAPVEIGQTAFGFIGVRMAKTIGVHDGGGTIRNSEGGVDEAGCFRKPARWCDYSGPMTRDVWGGATLMDHPSNLNHPAPFHVRDDGWMGVANTFPGAHSIQPGTPLRLQFAVYVHGGKPTPEALQKVWESWAASKFEDFPLRK